MITTVYVYNNLGASVSNLKIYVKENPSTFSFTDINGKAVINLEVGQTLILLNQTTGQTVSYDFNQKQDTIKVIFPLELVTFPVDEVLPEEKKCNTNVKWILAGLAVFGTVKILFSNKVKKVTI